MKLKYFIFPSTTTNVKPQIPRFLLVSFLDKKQEEWMSWIQPSNARMYNNFYSFSIFISIPLSYVSNPKPQSALSSDLYVIFKNSFYILTPCQNVGKFFAFLLPEENNQWQQENVSRDVKKMPSITVGVF